MIQILYMQVCLHSFFFLVSALSDFMMLLLFFCKFTSSKTSSNAHKKAIPGISRNPLKSVETGLICGRNRGFNGRFRSSPPVHSFFYRSCSASSGPGFTGFFTRLTASPRFPRGRSKAIVLHDQPVTSSPSE